MWSVAREPRQKEDDLFHFLIEFSDHVFLLADWSVSISIKCTTLSRPPFPTYFADMITLQHWE